MFIQKKPGSVKQEQEKIMLDTAKIKVMSIWYCTRTRGQVTN